MSQNKWCFLNLENSDESIVVFDEKSALILQKILAEQIEKWVLEGSEKAEARVEGQDRRAHERVRSDFRIILVCGAASFRTSTQDVSSGGIQLKQRVPDAFLGSKCMAYISSVDNRESLEMICEIVGDKKNPTRLRFGEVDSAQLKRLEEWIGVRK